MRDQRTRIHKDFFFFTFQINKRLLLNPEKPKKQKYTKKKNARMLLKNFRLLCHGNFLQNLRRHLCSQGTLGTQVWWSPAQEVDGVRETLTKLYAWTGLHDYVRPRMHEHSSWILGEDISMDSFRVYSVQPSRAAGRCQEKEAGGRLLATQGQARSYTQPPKNRAVAVPNQEQALG